MSHVSPARTFVIFLYNKKKEKKISEHLSNMTNKFRKHFQTGFESKHEIIVHWSGSGLPHVNITLHELTVVIVVFIAGTLLGIREYDDLG